MWFRMGTTVFVCLAAAPALANDACPKIADAWALARCAASRSVALRRASYEVQAAQGRHRAAEHLLPANPNIDVTVGHRKTEAGATDIDRGIEVSQSFEIAGQRGARVGIADVEVRAATARLEAAERQITADVLTGSVEVWRARETARFAAEQRELAQRLVEVSAARAREGVGPALDIELAEATRVQASRDELSAARGLREAAARLALTVGTDVELADGPVVAVAGPGQSVDDLVSAALDRRPLVRDAQANAEAGKHRLDLLRRERMPDVTIGAQFRHEEFSDIAGVRLSVPIPLFRRNQGQIIEQQALNADAEVAGQQARLKVSLEVRAAFAAWEQARGLAAQISPDLERRLAGDAQALRDAYVRGTLQLPAALASLREVFGARRTVSEARAEAVLATLDLLTASGGSVTPETGR